MFTCSGYPVVIQKGPFPLKAPHFQSVLCADTPDVSHLHSSSLAGGGPVCLAAIIIRSDAVV